MLESEIFVPKGYTRAIEAVGTTWPFDDFVRMHGEYEAVVVADSKKGMLEYGIFGDANGKHIVACVSDVVKKYSAEEFEKNQSNLEVVVLDSGLYCVCKRWEDVDLDRSPELIDMPKTTRPPSRRSEKKPNWLNLNEMKREAVKPYDAIRTPTDGQTRTESTRKSKIVRPPKESKPTSSHYLAVVIDMVIAIAVGISVYNSNMIHLEQDRMLFLAMCCVLAVVTWGYPYFDTSVKIDNDGCFAQGCIHPIIGVFGVLFFPLFIHYWMYKGIKVCLIRLNNVVEKERIVKKKEEEKKLRDFEREEYKRLQKIEDEKIEQERQKWLEENHRKAVERNARLSKLREHFREDLKADSESRALLRGDDYYLKHYSQTKEEYFRDNYNEVSTITAKCINNVSQWPICEEYSELEIGRTYHVSHIGVYKSSTRIVLQEFGDKEYNAVCFELYENGELMDDRKITRDRCFWAPYLREKFRK